VWAGEITPAARRIVTRISSPAVTLDKGTELGRFNMGSTVILLFENRRVVWDVDLRHGSILRLGARIGTACSETARSETARSGSL
jgi:phosphatidylserine decarboxylase